MIETTFSLALTRSRSTVLLPVDAGKPCDRAGSTPTSKNKPSISRESAALVNLIMTQLLYALRSPGL